MSEVNVIEDSREPEYWPLPKVDPDGQHHLNTVGKDSNISKRQRYRRGNILRSVLLAVACGLMAIALIIGVVVGLKKLEDRLTAGPKSLTTTNGTNGGHGQVPDDPLIDSGDTVLSCPSEFSDTFSSSEKWQGVNIGNWLILEKWMNPSYYNFWVPGDFLDEWSFCEKLDATCGSVLENHWDDWISINDIHVLSQAGYNLLRIPVGFWAFIEPWSWEPYYRGNQTQQLTRILSYARIYNMSVIIDLHGLPGSQNGEKHSGHVGSIDFFNSTNQVRSIELLKAVLSYVGQSPYRAQVVALEIANEPAVTSKSTLKIYKKYIKQGYKLLEAFNNGNARPLSLMFHDGFLGPSTYEDNFDICDPVVVDIHQYFTYSETPSSTMSEICSMQVSMATFLRQFYGEWSLATGWSGGNSTWYQQSFYSQARIYATSLGSAFWSFKSYNAEGNAENDAWSALGLLEDGLSVRFNSTNSTSLC